MDFYTTFVSFFQQGGPFMYPIAIVLGIGLAIALERYFYLINQTRVNRRDFEKILPLLKREGSGNLPRSTRVSKSAMARIIADGMNRRAISRRRSDIEYAMEEGLLEILPNIERRTPYLATFANIATLLGSARYHHRPDCGVHRGRQCRSGGESHAAVPEYFHCHEHHGLRSDGGDSAAAGAFACCRARPVQSLRVWKLPW